MATFTGTNADETITPTFVSPTVKTSGGNLPSDAADIIDAGGGNDMINAGGGDDIILAGAGNDTVIGGRGNDTALLGSGNDTFIWNPGDGSDVVEGQGGTDTLLFNGANIAENINISANGSRALFTRDVANIAMDLNGVERIQFNALGGADNIVVNDLSGTDVKRVSVDLSAQAGSGTGDGAADTVTVNGTVGDDHFSVSGTSASVTVSGMAAEVVVTGAEPDRDKVIVSGLAGTDTLQVNGTNAADTIGVVTDGQNVAVTGIGNAIVETNGVENVVISTGAGDDSINASGLISGLTQLTIDGGAGNDTIIGSQGADMILGGSGNDVITGGRGNDVALMGSGNDTFVWNPGDGSDIVEGQGGTDTLRFNGANIAENIAISANGSRALFTRDVANITMDLNDVEHIQFNALGGADKIVVNDLTGTDVKQVSIDLSAQPGSGTGDGAADTVTVTGTTGNDHFSVSGTSTSVTVSGLAADVIVTGAEANQDKVIVSGAAGGVDTLQLNGSGDTDTIGVVTDGQNVAVTGIGNAIVEASSVANVLISAGAGDDMVNASGLISGLTQLTIDGGTGNDTIIGSQGADMILGGSGNDMITGGRGNDVAMMGSGDDTFVWNPGDGSDTLEGQSGTDTLLFNGANIAENIAVSANGSRALFTRDIANISMDLNSVEHIQFNALGGADKIAVNDLSGTDVKQVSIDLAGSLGGNTGDGAADTVTVNGGNGNNHIDITASGTAVTVGGLSAQVTVDHADAGDRLIVNGGAGNDTINALAAPSGTVALTLAGGAGNDTLIGGAGNDTFQFTFGESGRDVVKGFQVHGASTQGDVIALSGFADLSFDQAIADGHIAQSGTDVVISDGTHVVATLQTVLLSSLHANDFMFS